MARDGSSLYRAAVLAGLEPDPELTVSEWADRYRRLPKASAKEAGLWRTSRTPYLAEIMDSLSATCRCRYVSFMKGAQLGGTEAGNNWIGYAIHQNPAPILFACPTLETARRASRGRIEPMLEDSPELRARVAPARSRDSANTSLLKTYPGGVLYMVGANSAIGLRQTTARFLFCDELDAWPGDVDGEGDPEVIAERAIRTFGDSAKAFKVSTPTITGRSRIERRYEESDQRSYYVPCPYCGVEQVLVWKQLKWDKGDPETAAYECEACSELIEEWHKTRMLAAGRWIPKHPERSSRHRGYHLSSLYSPLGWYSWSEAAATFMEAKGRSEALRAFVNTVLGETFAETFDAPPWQDLYERRESYEIGTCPAGVLFLTAGVDVQKDYLQLEVVGWGRGMESWSIEYRVVDGDVQDVETWQKLWRYIDRTFPTVHGGELSILRVLIDSGFETQHVYKMIRARGEPGRVLAIKGAEGRSQILSIPKLVDVTSSGKRLSRGIKLWTVGTDLVKGQLYGWLRQRPPLEDGAPYPDGYCHFPQFDAEFFEQLTSEHLVARIERGYRRFRWEAKRPRNEALDCRVYARAGAYHLGMDRMTDDDWTSLEDEVAKGSASEQRPKRRKAKRSTKRRKTGYLSRWRRERGG